MKYALISFFATGIISAIFTVVLIPVLRWFKLFDDPKTAARKVHARPVVLGGGIAITAALVLVFGAEKIFVPQILPVVTPTILVGIGLALATLYFFGLLDDKYNLPPHIQLLGPMFVTAIIILSGVLVTQVTNPWGGVLALTSFGWLPIIITAAWFLGMMYGTKLLDGLDGLVVGVSAIGAVMIFFLTHTAKFYQPSIGLVALLFAGACCGFLFFNFYPARIFLGEGGALFLGFFLALLAVVSGSKIATTLLVMGLPVFDWVRVALTRWVRGKNPFQADQLHLHHLLIRNGWSQRAAVLAYYLVATVFGVSALLFSSSGKIILLVALALFVWGTATFLERRLERRI